MGGVGEMTDILEQANYVVIDYDKKRKEKARQVFTDAFLTACFLLDGDDKVKSNDKVDAIIQRGVNACISHMSGYCTVDAVGLEIQFMLTYLYLFTVYMDLLRPLEPHEVSQMAGSYFDAHIWGDCVR